MIRVVSAGPRLNENFVAVARVPGKEICAPCANIYAASWKLDLHRLTRLIPDDDDDDGTVPSVLIRIGDSSSIRVEL